MNKGDKVGLAKLQTVRREVVETAPVVFYEGVVAFETQFAVVFVDGLSFNKSSFDVVIPVKDEKK